MDRLLLREFFEDRTYPEGHQVLRRVARALRRGEVPHPEDVEILSEMVAALDDGKPANQAFRLKRRGRPKESKVGQQFEKLRMAIEVEEAREEGATREEACSLVAERWGRDERSVQTYYSDNRVLAEQDVIYRNRRRALAEGEKKGG